MVKSSRRKKQDRAKAEARRIERERQRGKKDQVIQKAENLRRLRDPEMTPAEVATLIAAEFPDWAGAGTVARDRLRDGVPLAEVAETARLLLAEAGESPEVSALSFAAEFAHAEGDEETERHYAGELLARAETTCDTGLWLHVVRCISGWGRPGEAIELIEPYLRDHLQDTAAAFTYSLLLREAAEASSQGEKERAALQRFTDRAGLAEVKSAVMTFIKRTKWDEVIKREGAGVLDLIPAWQMAELPANVHEECAALALEAAVKGAQDGIADLTPQQLMELYKESEPPDTVLTAFAADRETPSALARRASDWSDYGHYGLWQLMYPTPDPGVGSTDLVSGVTRYIEFPPATVDGVPRWSVWLGGVIPVNGVWRAMGTGFMLSPAEADAVADTIGNALEKLVNTLSGMPLAEMLPAEPIPYGNASPWGVRWEYFNSPGVDFAQRTSGVVMMLAPRIVADAQFHRTARKNDEHRIINPAPTSEAWLDQGLLALDGLTPREANEADTSYQMMLEALLRQLEYEAELAAREGRDVVDIGQLRAALKLDGE